MAEDADIGSGAGDYKDKTIKRSLSNNLNNATSYLIPNTRQTFTQLMQAFTKALIF